MHGYLPLLVILSFTFFSSSDAKLVNVTIDDTSGDPTTGSLVSYQPQAVWKGGSNCTGCTALPDVNLAYNKTWHEGTFTTDQSGNNNVPGVVGSASVQFNGTAIYVFGILSRATADGISDMTFTIDDVVVGSFERTPTGENVYDYNVPLYANASLPPGKHEFALWNGRVGGEKSLAILDYITYSYDDGTPDASAPSSSSSSSPASQPSSHSGIVAGAIIGAFCALFFTIGLGICVYRQYKRRARAAASSTKGNLEAYAPRPTITYTLPVTTRTSWGAAPVMMDRTTYTPSPNLSIPEDPSPSSSLRTGYPARLSTIKEDHTAYRPSSRRSGSTDMVLPPPAYREGSGDAILAAMGGEKLQPRRSITRKPVPKLEDLL